MLWLYVEACSATICCIIQFQFKWDRHAKPSVTVLGLLQTSTCCLWCGPKMKDSFVPVHFQTSARDSDGIVTTLNKWRRTLSVLCWFIVIPNESSINCFWSKLHMHDFISCWIYGDWKSSKDMESDWWIVTDCLALVAIKWFMVNEWNLILSRT